MKSRILTLILFVLTGISSILSQPVPADFTMSHDMEINDSIDYKDLPVLSDEVYSIDVILDRNYEYELLNKRLKLIKMSNDLKIVGSVSMFAVMGIFIGIGVTQDWNSWVMIGCGLVGAFGSEWLFNKIASNLRKKADAIVVNSVSVAGIGSNAHILASTFSSRGQKLSGIGLGIQYDF